LEAKRSGKKAGVVTGAVQLQFILCDPTDASAPPQQILQKLAAICGSDSNGEDERLERMDTGDLEEYDDQEEAISGADDSGLPEAADKKKRRLRLARLKKKAKERGYEFTNGTDVAGVLFVEIQKITDLPPEKNGKCEDVKSTI
jgi:phosphatidylserine decarboxylase